MVAENLQAQGSQEEHSREPNAKAQSPPGAPVLKRQRGRRNSTIKDAAAAAALDDTAPT